MAEGGWVMRGMSDKTLKAMEENTSPHIGREEAKVLRAAVSTWSVWSGRC